MRNQDSINRIRHKKMYVISIGFMYVHYVMYFYYLLFVIQVLSLNKLGNLIVYVSQREMCGMLTKLLFVC